MQQQIDCAACGLETNREFMVSIGNFDHCLECAQALQKRILPLWVKLFMAGIGLIIVVSFAWNWNYLDGYNKLNSATEMMSQNKLPEAAQLMAEASARVPEVNELYILSEYYKGLHFLSESENDQALKCFSRCENWLPEEYNLKFYTLSAQMSACFDRKDYQGFLEKSKAMFVIDSTTADAHSRLASAHACLYVSRDSEPDRTLAYKHLDQAKAIDNKSDEARFYYNFLEYRLEMKDIITRDEFVKRFPQGWSK